MLIEKSTRGEGQSKFTCDRCEVNLTTETRRGVYIQQNNRMPKKHWDLCGKCFASLKRGIEKGKNRRHI